MFNAFGNITTGLILPISANTGIGSSRCAAKSYKARPPLILPVNPTAFTFGFNTNCCPTSIPLLFKFENTPFGIPVFSAALITAPATISPVAACIGCDFTITGHPAANAAAVSPPAVENANGKLEAPKTTTGPRAIFIFLKSTFGIGWRSGWAVSIEASTHSPASTWSAKALNCPKVLPRSPLARPFGNPLSEWYTSKSSSPKASISSAIALKNVAFCAPEVLEYVL